MRFAIALVVAVCLAGTAIAADDHQQMNSAAGGLPREGGQSAFAAIQEIVGILSADPNTDWSSVNIDALREHLIDMDNLALRARIAYEPKANGQIIRVAGDGAVRQSIQRMVKMHAAMSGDTADWRMAAAETSDGVEITVVAKSPLALQKIKALGLIGMMAEGVHHTRHHLMLARGKMGSHH
jgi:hypothetical protein